MTKPPIWLAVDTADIAHARALIAEAGPSLGGVKLGLEFFMAHGPDGVREVMRGQELPLFLDVKLHDIPNTVARAVESVAPLAPALLTIHASGGPAMIRAARDAAPASTKIIAVTVLTSLDEEDLAAVGVPSDPRTQVKKLAALARDNGADGMVCSPHEVADAASLWPEGFFVVPGVRPAGSAIGDQKRVMTPRDALAAGATALVIGRPISASPDPKQAAADILASL